MTQEEKLLALGAMGCEDSDEVLLTYLRLAGQKIIDKAFPYRNDVVKVPKKYEALQLEIAVYLLNKRGAEGEIVHLENGISRHYKNADVPDSMLKSVVPYCGVMR